MRDRIFCIINTCKPGWAAEPTDYEKYLDDLAAYARGERYSDLAEPEQDYITVGEINHYSPWRIPRRAEREE